ncbi:MAG: hypothetical protein IID39_06520 [Planctomycetes bacterium]|nr:hypothetical protein [Planctomycetota bacterium]
MPDEKKRLLALFDDESKWCQDSEACDHSGQPVSYDDETAVSWDLVGGLCHLFGWERASELFGQLHRHVVGWQKNRNGPVEEGRAMAALLDFNDAVDTTYESIVAMLEGIPAWRDRAS